MKNAHSFRRLTWWQKTRITAFLFALLGLIAVVAVTQLSGLAGSDVKTSQLVWATQTVLPLLTVVVIGIFTRAQRSIDLRGGFEAGSQTRKEAK